MMNPKKEISSEELRSFGLIFTSGILLIFGLFFPWLLDHQSPQWPWFVAGVTFLPALLMPSLLAPVYKVWMKIGAVLGWINTRIILGLIFFIVFVPMSVIFYLLKKDPMNRRFDASATSYRTESIKPPRDRMEYPF